ncbi:MAG: hypothetical protein HY051_02855 [Candidatus Aenigmarchaeota archaeon]|nr:hypothetical protein [Candidatus Aenigmarchaeota archaeon]
MTRENQRNIQNLGCASVIVLSESKTHLGQIEELVRSELGRADREKVAPSTLVRFLNSEKEG